MVDFMKNQKMEYSVGELSNFFGISKDAIRLYDKMGIIAAKKSERNNYRVYSREDLLCLDYVMRLRKMEFTLEEIRVLINESAPSKAEAMMQVQEKLIGEKIEMLKNMKTIVSDYRKSFGEIIQNLENMNIEKSPTFIYKDVDNSLTDVMKVFQGLSQTQMSKFTFVCEKETFLSDDFSEDIKNREKRQKMFKYAVTIIDDEHLAGRDGFNHEQFKVISPYKCVHSIVKNYTNIDYSGFEKMRKFIVENRLHIVDDPIFRVVSFRNNKKESIDYYDVWVPIE